MVGVGAFAEELEAVKTDRMVLLLIDLETATEALG
jgi:hypothetical protein